MQKNSKHFISDSINISGKEKFTESLDIETISKAILNNPAIINKPEGQFGWTFLYKAVVLENYDLCEFLLEKMANPNIQNFNGESPLHQAVESGNNKIINLLLENGANPNIQQKDGETPMHIACIKGDYKIVKLLIIYGADPILKSTQNNFTPLDYAIEANQQKCIAILGPIVAENHNKLKNETNTPSRERGFKTTKNSESPINRIKNKIDFNVPHTVNLPNMTSKNSSVKIDNNNEEVEDFEIADNVITRNPTNISVITGNFNYQDMRESKNFMIEMSQFEEKLKKIKNELNIVNNMNEHYQSQNLNSTNNDSKFNIKGKHVKSNSNLDNINMDELWHNFSKNNNEELSNLNFHKNENVRGKQYNKSYFIGGSYNFDEGELVNVNNFYPENHDNNIDIKEMQDANEKYFIELQNTNKDTINGNYTFNNFDENMVVTLKPEEIEGFTSAVVNQNNSRISYNTNNLEDNSPKQKTKNNNNSRAFKNGHQIKISENYFEEAEIRSSKKNKKIYEVFEDNEKVLAVFTSAVNDIINGEDDQNVYGDLDESVKGNEYNKKESIQSNYINNNYNNFFEDECEQNSLFTEQNHNNNNTSSRKNVKYFSKNKSIKEEFKQISLDTYTIQDNEILMMKKSHNSNNMGEDENLNDDDSTENVTEIYNFLKSIDLECFTNSFIKNGFDDLSMIKEQIRSSSPITDYNLKEIGIFQAGFRARILIKLEEETKLYDFVLPLNIFYNIQIDKNNQWKNDHNIKSINLWLSQIKMEKYLDNFVKNGYHSLELLMFQMYSKNPLTDHILEQDLKIDKIGYISRIINKLKTDSKIYVEKLKSNKIKLMNNKTDEKHVDSCKCLVF